MSLVQTLGGHAHSVWAVDFSADFLVSGAADKKVRAWKRRRKGGEEEGEGGGWWEQHCEMEDHGSGTANCLS